MWQQIRNTIGIHVSITLDLITQLWPHIWEYFNRDWLQAVKCLGGIQRRIPVNQGTQNAHFSQKVLRSTLKKLKEKITKDSINLIKNIPKNDFNKYCPKNFEWNQDNNTIRFIWKNYTKYYKYWPTFTQ